MSVPISSSVIAAMVMAIAVQGAVAAPARTPDQQLVAGLKTARAASQTALSSISPASPTGAKKAAAELSRAIKGIDAASNAAASAVALETPSVRTAVRQGKGAREAGAIGRRRRTLRSRTSEAPPRQGTDVGCAERLRRAARERLSRVRLNPRERGGHRSAHIRQRCGGGTGLSALVGRDIAEVVIGVADRRTANAGEAGAASSKSRGLSIKWVGPAFLVEASGAYTTNHCSLKSGLIVSPVLADAG